MAEVLYRKYRSKSFGEIVGQKEIVGTLKESILQDRLSHSYLFSGARGTGKTSIARIFAKAVNCYNFDKVGDVCNECEACIAVSSFATTDIVEMDAASNRGVDEIRDMKGSVDFVPGFLKRKIYIIDEAHMLTKEAFNALLKTLEEPPAHVIFIFATTEPYKLPVTILSRVQRYDFSLGTKEDIRSKLTTIIQSEGVDIEDGVLDLVFKKSGGSFRDAESILGKIMVTARNKKVTVEDVYSILGIVSDEDLDSFINSLLEKNLDSAKAMFEQFVSTGLDLSFFIDQIVERVRERLIENVGGKVSQLLLLVTGLIGLKRDIREFSNKRAVFEIFLIKACTTDVSAPKAVVKQAEKVVSEVEEEEEEIQEKVETVVSVPIVNLDEEGLRKELVRLSDSISNRFKAILSGCNILISGNTLKVTNPVKFNLTFLNKKDHIDFLLLNSKKFFANIEDVEFEQSEGTSEPTPVSVVSKPKREEVDNTELINSIL